MQNRRVFLRTVVATTTSAVAFLKNLMGPHHSFAAPAILRAPAKDRRRRIIYNDDGDYLWYVAHGIPWSGNGLPSRFKSVDQFLEFRVKGALEGTQVDSLAYCAFINGPSWEYPWDNLEGLRPDPINHVVDYAHQKGVEFIYSLRMNDIHKSVYPMQEQWSRFQLENPQVLQAHVGREEFEKKILPWTRGLSKEHPLADVVKRRGRRSVDFHSWACYDYSHPEVRNYLLQVIEEACQRYDLDGIELDWNRGPLLFRTEEERLRSHPIMTDFIHQVHQRVEQQGRKRGRRILLWMRVLDSPALSLAAALDAETWLRQGWVDILVAGGGYAPFSFPLAEWVRLGHAHGIPVYGYIDAHTSLLRDHHEAIRAAASRYWSEGVDGIYIMNLYGLPDAPTVPRGQRFNREHNVVLNEIGDPNQLARRNKIYQVDALRIGGYGALRLDEEQGLFHYHDYPFSHWWPQLPLAFTTQSGPIQADLNLHIGDDPKKASRVMVQTAWQPAIDPKRVAWQVNGQPLSNPTLLSSEEHAKRLLEVSFNNSPEPGWTVFEIRGLRKGLNKFHLTLQPSGEGEPPEPVVLSQVRISIVYS